LYKGVVIDHHPLHNPDHKYILYYDNIPTGLIIYKMFSHRIPKEYHWLVVGSCMGDGQVDLVPTEIWRNHPILLEEVATVYTSRDDSLFMSKVPIYYKLSSPINDLCRCNMPESALRVVQQAQTPYDIIYNDSCKIARDKVKNEVNRVFKNYSPIDLGKIIYYIIDSDLKIESYLATRLENRCHKTVVVVNERTKKISIRGILSEIIRIELSNKYRIGGHPFYSGGSIPEELNTKDLLQDLRTLRL